MGKLEDRVIIVTGSTTGIGQAIARRCWREGARVVFHGLEDGLNPVLAAEMGNRAVYVRADLAEAAAAGGIVAKAVEAFGRVDAVVNNAAWVVRGRIETTTAEFFDRVIAVNVRAPYLLIREALPHLQAAGGNVLNIGSVNAYSGEENLLPYSVSKGALMTLTRNLGDALPRTHGVRVNQINPGWVLTENERRYKREEGMEEDWPSKLPKMFAPSGRIFAPREIAEAAMYFLSPASGPISGQVLDIEQHPFIGRNPPKC